MDRKRYTLGDWAGLAAIILLAIFARWPSHPHPYLWLDEAWRAYSVATTDGPFSFLAYMRQNSEVLLASEWVLGKISWHLFAHHPFGFRVWPLIFSLVSIMGAWAFTRKSGQIRLALGPALLIAASFGFVYHSREFKPYALDLALAMWLLWATLDALEKRRYRLLISLLTMTAASSLSFLFLFPAVTVFLLIRTHPDSPLRLWPLVIPLLTFIFIYLGFLQPQSPGGTTAFWHANYLTSVADAMSLARRYPAYLNAYTFSGWMVISVLYFVALPVVSLRRRDGLWLLLLTPFFIQVVAAMLRIYPFLDRPSYYLYGIMIVGAAIALGGLVDLATASKPALAPRIKTALCILLLGWVVGAGTLQRDLAAARVWPPDTGRAAMKIMAHEFSAEDSFYVSSGAYFTFLFHRNGIFPVGHPLRTWVLPKRREILTDNDPQRLLADLHRLAGHESEGQRIWFLSGYFPDTADRYVRVLKPVGHAEIKVAQLHQALITIRLNKPMADLP